MLAIKFIRENPNKVKEGCKKKQVKVDIDYILKLDEEKRKYQKTLENLRARQKRLSFEIPLPLKKLSGIKNEIKKMEPRVEGKEVELKKFLLLVPNLPLDEVPEGKDERDNVILKEVGERRKFNFKIKSYIELGKNLDLVDTERAAKVSGTRFGYLKNEAVLLEFALINFTFEDLIKRGFIPVVPPVMLKEEMARGTGYFEAADKEEAYFIPEDNLYLVGTSEQSLIAMHSDEIFEEKVLPKRYLGFSTCFRREAGSYGKDTKGIFRVHQFDKIEMVTFCKPEDSRKEHQFFLGTEEKLMQSLKIPYRLVRICTGDLGRPAASKFDIEAWFPSENRYRETHSTSNCTDFQARRLNIRYKDKSGRLNFVHTINGTAFAIGRALIPIFENYQQRDGTIKIPEVLQKYIFPKKKIIK